MASVPPFALLFCRPVASLRRRSASAQDRRQRLPRVAVEDDGNGVRTWLAGRGRLEERPAVAVRLVLSGPPSEGGARRAHSTRHRAAADTAVALASCTERARSEIDPWRAALRRFVERRGSTLALCSRSPSIDSRRASPRSRCRPRRPRLARSGTSVRVALGGEATIDVARRGELYTAALAPYVDLLSLPENRIDAAEAWLHRIDPGAPLVVTSGRWVTPARLGANANRRRHSRARHGRRQPVVAVG